MTWTLLNMLKQRLIITFLVSLLFTIFILCATVLDLSVISYEWTRSKPIRCTPTSLVFYSREGNSTRCFSERWIPLLKRFGLHGTYSEIKNPWQSKSVFVTAISENHFKEAIQVVVSFAKVREHESLVIYDLGLDQDQFDSLSSLPFILLKKFNFHKYPKYVGILRNYRWKPLIIAEELVQNPSLWWLDASSLFGRTGLPIETVIGSPITLFDNCSHSIFTATHPTMFEYLQLSMNRSQTFSMFGANLIYIRGTIAVKRDVIRWWVLCALEENCMAPSYSRVKCPSKRSYDRYANCHRFDQSAINIILANFYNYETIKYQFIDFVVARENNFPFVHRNSTHDETDLKKLIANANAVPRDNELF